MIVRKNYNAAEEISKQPSAVPPSSQVEELQCQNIKRKTSILRPSRVVNGHVRLTRSARARRKRLKFQPQQSKQQRRDDQDINPSISAMTRQYDAQQDAELSALMQAYTINEGSDSEEDTMETMEG